uniref:Uncharacterized protein n=1 Tax=Molossus molossus TaxID=27622 RepID=A0A7J8J107_MOLMO|nr:hypothetical protein HJG59_010389 [Molossus molossus]
MKNYKLPPGTLLAIVNQKVINRHLIERFSTGVLQETHWCATRIFKTALAGLAQWLEHRPAVQRDLGSVPAKGAYLGCSLSPVLVGLCGWQPLNVSLSRQCFSLSLSLSFPLYLNKKWKNVLV